MLATILMVANSCDSRSSDNPSISVVIYADTLYTHPQHSQTQIQITLTGAYQSLYSNKIIEIEYDSDIANVLTNSGDASFFRTNENGFASGSIIARNQGNLNIMFKVKNHSSVKSTKQLKVLKPFVFSIRALPQTIPADFETRSTIDVLIKPGLNNETVLFSTDYGVLSADSTSTFDEGIARTFLKSAAVGMANVSASLKSNPSQSKSIKVYFE